MLVLCRLDLILLTAHTLSADQRSQVITMSLQALLMLRDRASASAPGSCLLDCAALALLLSLLHYLLLPALQPPAAMLINSVNKLLKVREKATPCLVNWLGA